MSGIAGIFYRNGRLAKPDELRAMLSAISHRGPDRQDVYLDGPAGLGHCVLFNTPESTHESQPLSNSSKNLVITADVRLDNRKELIQSLKLDYQKPGNIGDAEIILNAYEKWNEGCVARLLGDFAFAIWDRGKQRFFCAVDHFRIRPLCYFNSPQFFAFSSQPAGLLPGKLVPDELNKVRLGALFFEEISEIDKTTSFYKDIYYLQPGSWLLADKDTIRVGAYWSTDEIDEIHRGTDEEYQQEFIQTLTASVACRTRSYNYTGIALSGGIDSAAVAGIANNITGNNGPGLITVSGLSGDESKSIESGYIRRALNSLGKNPVLFTPRDVESFYDRLVSLIRAYDSPLVSQNLFLIYLYLVTRENHCRILLDGSEADTLLGIGGHYIPHLFRRFKIIQGFREARLHSTNTINNPDAFFPLLLNSMRAAYLPNFSRPWAYGVRNRLNYRKLIRNSAINPEFADQIALLERLAQVRKTIGYGIMDSVNAMRIRAFNRPFVSWIPVTLDMLSSSCGVELRHPYLDKRMVEFSLGLPWDQKGRDGWDKYILRKSTQDLVPESIRWRKGRDHVGWEFCDLFVKLMYHELSDIVADRNHPVYEYFDYHLVSVIFKRHEKEMQFTDKMKLLRLYGLYQWLQNI